MQEIKDKMQEANLLELFEEALEIQEGFKHLLALSNKNKKMLTAELMGKRPVGRPRKVAQEVATATQARVVQEQGSAKNEASPQTQGQDTQALQTPQSTTQDTQSTKTKQQQRLGTSKPSSPKEPQKANGKKPKKDK
ncbi:hypothetical protein [Helicobacter felistomachi]|uniref:hypothetical protein n=1 Tax=Helicobacter felistomachi TaxID=3040201 RepID=UPI0025747110|nr:hypothetical protein [Helicobacter sp. NHP21005]